jgi:hypothetical protein
MSEGKTRKPWWILTFRQRKFLSRKFRDTEKLIQENKDSGNWSEVSRLQSLLRRVWWGIKRYRDK